MSEASSRCSSYPVVVEPFIRLGDQARLWSPGFYVLIALIAGCGVLLWRSADRPPSAAADGAAEAAPPTWRDAATWIALAAVPSGLLVAVTAHISTDVAAVPLLWVLPLALYLLTFVIVFQRRPIIPALAGGRGPAGVHPRSGHRRSFFEPDSRSIVGLIAVHLVVFFVCALMCHGELARRRPAPQIPHRLLYVDVGRRHDRRHRRRPWSRRSCSTGSPNIRSCSRSRCCAGRASRCRATAATATSCLARSRSRPCWP